MTTIELGEIESTPGPGPVTEFGHHLVRRVAIALTLLLCLLGPAASTHGSTPMVRTLWSVPLDESDGATLGADAAYLQRGTANPAQLTSYDLTTGRVRWATAIDGGLGYTQLAEAAGLILLPTVPPPASTDGARDPHFNRATRALDLRTGRNRWTAPGEPMLIEGRTALMVDYAGDGSYARLRLVGLDADAPHVIWSRDTPDVESLAMPALDVRTDRLILIRRDGFVQVVRFVDGVVLLGAHIPWKTPDPQRGEYNDVAPAGDYLVVNRGGESSSDLSVYRLDTLAEAWRADTAGRGYAYACGTGICFDDSNSVTGYDAGTGRKRWQLDGFNSSWAVGHDRLVAQEASSGQQLFDTETGQPVGAAGEGQTVDSVSSTELADDALFVLRHTREPPARTSIIRWELATGHRRLLGAVAGLTADRCQLVPHYLGCYEGHQFVITAVD
jgi:hypothetical protein